MKKNILLLIYILILLSSCGNEVINSKTVEDECDSILQINTDTILTNNDIRNYFEKFKMLLLEERIEDLTDLIYFPVEGDYSWEETNEKGELSRDFNPYRKKEDFINNYSKLFGSDLIKIFQKVDLEKFFQEDYHVFFINESNQKLNFSIDFESYSNPITEKNPTAISFEIDYETTDSDIGEKGIIYRFKKINGEIKLFAIQFVG